MESEGAEVRRGLCIGSLTAACDEEWLAARGITHILTVAWGIAPFWPEVQLPPLSSTTNYQQLTMVTQ